MEVGEVKDLMNSTNQWLKTLINLVNFAAQTQANLTIKNRLHLAQRSWIVSLKQPFSAIPPVIGFWYRQGEVIPHVLHETAYAGRIRVLGATLRKKNERKRARMTILR